MAMGCVGPGGRRNGEEVMAEVDESFYVLPVVEKVILHISACSNIMTQTHKHSIHRY